MIYFNQLTLKENPIYTSKKNLFTKDECENIKELFPLLTGNMVQPSTTAGGDTRMKRSSSNVWIPFGGDFHWLYERVAEASKELNIWGFDLSGFFENFQLTLYRQGDHYSWHQDAGVDNMSLRKLSAVVQLSSMDEYAGGDLEFFLSQKDDALKEQGTAIFFPSYQVHRVAPVIEGQRMSLVIWMSGNPYR